MNDQTDDRDEIRIDGEFHIRISKPPKPGKNDPVRLRLQDLKGHTMIVPMFSTDKTTLTFIPENVNGDPVDNPQYVSGSAPIWSNPSGITKLVPAADGMTCDAFGQAGQDGTDTVTCVAQMVTSKGPKSVPGTIQILVSLSPTDPTITDPESLEVSATTPVPQGTKK